MDILWIFVFRSEKVHFELTILFIPFSLASLCYSLVSLFIFGRMETNQRAAAVRVHVAHGQAISEKGLDERDQIL
jgi:hypothetical protein